MRSLSFITRYSEVYRGPLVEIHVDDKAIALAIPQDFRKKKDTVRDQSRTNGFIEQLNLELSKEEYDLFDYEINAIIEYLTTEEFFKNHM